MQYLGLASDILLLAATLGMALWCRRLAARPTAVPVETGPAEAALAALAARIDALERAGAAAATGEDDRAARLAAETAAADDRIGRLEMLLASLEDIEEEAADRVFMAESPSADPALPSFRAARQPAVGAVR